MKYEQIITKKLPSRADRFKMKLSQQKYDSIDQPCA